MDPINVKGEAKVGRRPRDYVAIGLALALVSGGLFTALAAEFDFSADASAMGPALAGVPGRTSKPPKTPAQPLPALRANERLSHAYLAVFGTSETTGAIRGEYRYSGGKILPIGKNGAIFLVPTSHVEAFPVNMGALGIFYLVEGNGKYAVKGRWPEFIGGSIMGSPPEWTVRDDLTDFPVVVATAGGIWQGYMCQTTMLVELRPDAPHVIADFPSLYSDGGAMAEGEQSTEIEGRIDGVVKNSSFNVRFEGSRSFTLRYNRSNTRTAGGKYVLVHADDTVPTC